MIVFGNCFMGGICEYDNRCTVFIYKIIYFTLISSIGCGSYISYIYVVGCNGFERVGVSV